MNKDEIEDASYQRIENKQSPKAVKAEQAFELFALSSPELLKR